MEPFFPPTPGQLRAISEDIREEIKKRQKDCPLWCGGTISSNFRPYYADVDPQGNFRKIFFKDGYRREFFLIE
jgi:hypothetical protein